MAAPKKKVLTKEQKLKAEIEILKSALEKSDRWKTEHYTELIKTNQEFKAYKEGHEGRRDARYDELQSEVRRLMEIIRWNANAESALCTHEPYPTDPLMRGQRW